MKNILCFLLIIIMIFLPDCVKEKKQSNGLRDDPAVSEELAKLWNDYIDVSNSGNIDKLMTFFTDDYINMPYFGSTQTGLGELKTFMKDFGENDNPTIMKYDRIELFIHSSMAYEFGMLEMSRIPVCGDQIIFKQRCMTVFKKDAEGKWKFHRWMGQPESQK